MTCRKVVKQLPAYLANELPDRTRSRVEAHLKHCGLCTAELGALKRTDQLLGTLPMVEPRRDLVGAVMEHIEREQDTVPAFKRFLISLRERQSQLRYAAVNVLLVVVLALTIVRLNWKHQNRLAKQSSIASSGGPGGRTEPGAVTAENGRWRLLPRIDMRRVFVPAKRPGALVIPLTPEGIESLNDEIAKAREGSGTNAADASFIMTPGPNGRLYIRPVELEKSEPLGGGAAGE